jgi:heparosan-N-sulfate-glucuronate 5-epimerase
MDTLTNILPYYDVGGFSTYDLSHITYKISPTINPGYHSIHIYELHALNSIYENKWLKHFENTWVGYIKQ